MDLPYRVSTTSFYHFSADSGRAFKTAFSYSSSWNIRKKWPDLKKVIKVSGFVSSVPIPVVVWHFIILGDVTSAVMSQWLATRLTRIGRSCWKLSLVDLLNRAVVEWQHGPAEIGADRRRDKDWVGVPSWSPCLRRQIERPCWNLCHEYGGPFQACEIWLFLWEMSQFFCRLKCREHPREFESGKELQGRGKVCIGAHAKTKLPLPFAALRFSCTTACNTHWRELLRSLDTLRERLRQRDTISCGVFGSFVSVYNRKSLDMRCPKVQFYG